VNEFGQTVNPTSARIFGVLTQNAQGATIYGADIETRYLVTSSDQFDLSIYPLHARFGSVVIPGFFGGDYSRNVLPLRRAYPTISGFSIRGGLSPAAV